MSVSPDLSALEQALGVVFRDKDLLLRAVTHRSYLNEHREARALGHNELLEFLGDSVLQMGVTEYLFRHFTEFSEGSLTNLRAELVNTKILIEVAWQLNVPTFLRCANGEARELERNPERRRAYANALEAIIAAIYLDRGSMTAEMFVLDTVLPRLQEVLRRGTTTDWISQLQELVQARERITPHYRTLNTTGPEHKPEFTVGVFVGARQLATGKGPSQKEAKFQAALEALQTYGK